LKLIHAVSVLALMTILAKANGQIPTPPSNATVFKDVQNSAGNPGHWVLTATKQEAGGLIDGSASQDFNVPTPSLSDSAYSMDCRGAGANCLAYRHLGCTKFPDGVCSGVWNVKDDFYFLIPESSSTIQAWETDPDAYDGTHEEFPSHQLDSVTGHWRFWNMAARKWTETAKVYPSNLLKERGKYHHFQSLEVIDMNNHTYTYEDLSIDGVPVYSHLGLTYAGAPLEGNRDFNIEHQIDNSKKGESNTVFIDEQTVTVWPVK